LRLAAELLREGETPLRLADWNSPAVLLRKFLEARIDGGSGASERQITLEIICRRMTDTHSMTISLKELSLDVSGRTSVNELRGRGILQAPALQHGTNVGGDEIRFTHHLLHDYAIACSLIPETPANFYDFAIRKPLLPIFYRQSLDRREPFIWPPFAFRKLCIKLCIKNHKPPAINSRTSTGCGYRLGCLGVGLLQPMLSEGFAQMRSRSESVEFGTS
jgi:hypothetical protein